MTTYLIVHTNSKGTGVACKDIEADTELEAVRIFERSYPQRTISQTSIKEA